MDKKTISCEECKQIQMTILDRIADICTEYGLRYYLAYGTMLGAVRHKGYIPWDDDIDIFMDRPDYEKLISLLKQTPGVMPEWMELLDLSTDGYYYPFAKAVDSRTVAKMDSNVTKHGIWIDIFPVDGVPENLLLCKLFCLYCHCLRAIIISMTTDFSSKKLGIKGILKGILSCAAKIIGKDRIAAYYDRVCRKYDTASSKYVACLSSAYGSKDRLLKEKLYCPKDYEFEGRQYCGTANYEDYLGSLYGDYMKLPPEDKRVVHSVTAWRID